MPRWPNKELNAAEQELNKEESLILPVTGQVVRDDNTIVAADGPISDDYANELSFLEEKVDVMVHESTDPNAENPVQVACNGINQFFFRGQTQTVKRKFVEILARAKTTSIATREVRDYAGDLTTRIDKATALRYPFSIISDPNPKGASWLKSVLAQG